jgi:hypothetical protein
VIYICRNNLKHFFYKHLKHLFIHFEIWF